jgi:hypothetical protein
MLERCFFTSYISRMFNPSLHNVCNDYAKKKKGVKIMYMVRSNSNYRLLFRQRIWSDHWNPQRQA